MDHGVPGNRQEIECIAITLPPPSSLAAGATKPKCRVPGASGALEENTEPRGGLKADILFVYGRGLEKWTKVVGGKPQTVTCQTE